MEIKTLYDKQQAIFADMTDLKQRLKSENRGFTPDEEQRFEKAYSDFEATKKQIESLEKLNEVTAEAPVEARSIEPTAAPKQPSYNEAWKKYASRRELNAADRKVLQRGTNTITTTTSGTTYGGYNVPTELASQVEITMAQFGGMLEAAEIIRTAGGGPYNHATLDDTTTVASIVGEGSSTTKQDLTFGQFTLGSYTYRTLAVFSEEFMQDEETDIMARLGGVLGERFGRAVNAHLTTGTGSGQPTGIITSASTGFTGASTTAVTGDDLFDLMHSVDPAYRRGNKVAWMFNDATLKVISKLTIGSADDRPLWVPSLREGAPATILGHRYVINQDMADLGAAAKPIAFGDWSKYIIRRVRDVVLRRLDERYADELAIGYLAFARYDGKLLNTNAIKVFANAAS